MASKDALIFTRIIFQQYFTPVITIIGCFTNILNLIVLSNWHLQSSTNVYLKALAVLDMSFLLSGFLHCLETIIESVCSINIFMFLKPIFQTSATLFNNLAVWTVCLFTMERYIVGIPIIFIFLNIISFLLFIYNIHAYLVHVYDILMFDFDT